MRKSRILASQNPPKIHPKRIRNRCPNKHAILTQFLLEKTFVAKVPTSISYWFLQYFWLVGHFFSNRFWHAFSVPKTSLKPLQNKARTLEKSMPKKCCFLTLIFSGFSFDLGVSWASKLEPSWLKRRIFIVGVALLGRSKNLFI